MSPIDLKINKIMLTDKDIQKLIKFFPTRDDAVLKGDFEELRQDFRNLQSAVDNYAKRADDYFQEMVILSRKVDRLEQWIYQLAKKIGLKLEV